jgi:hypothetical protein
MKYTFGDIVVVDKKQIGVIVKSWISIINNSNREKVNHEVYVRSYNTIKEYPESKIERYMVRHKYLTPTEKKFQFNALNDL